MINGVFRDTFQICIESSMHISNVNWHSIILFFQIIFSLDIAFQML